MKKFIKVVAAIMLIGITVYATGCKKEKKAEVETSPVTNVTSSSATAGGTVTFDGNSTVIERGVCWGRNENPDVGSNHLNSGTGMGSFTCNITDLEPATTYYVRAYAINNTGISYGSQVTFTTLTSGGGNGGDNGGGGNGGGNSGGSSAPTGGIDGQFSVSATKQVYFSKGNLQYQASTKTWRFAESQLETIGYSNANASSSYIGWIDLFAWGTSGYDHGAYYYQPWSWENVDNNGGNLNFYAYGSYNYNLGDQTGQADWGYNPIQNGGNQENKWRTMTYEEWDYLLNGRNTASGMRFVKALVNSTAGIVLFPDNWNASNYDVIGVNETNTGFGNTTISSTYWTNIFEKNGAVFLPAAGYKCQDSDGHMIVLSDSGRYWTSSTDYTAVGNSKGAYQMSFSRYHLAIYGGSPRCEGASVRLVQDAN